MDPTRFDDLVRSLNYPASRRRTLGVLLGSTLAGLGLGADAAKRKHRQHREASTDACKSDGKACTKDSQCCNNSCVGATGKSVAHSGGTCRPACSDANVSCAGDSECCSNVCAGSSIGCCPVCPGGCFCTLPDGSLQQVCIALEGSGQACSGQTCPPGEVCVGGTCYTNCPPVT